MTVPASSPVDDALDRLEDALSTIPLPNAYGESLATVREELQRLREERDALERDRDSWVDQCEDARRWEAKHVYRAEAAEAEVRRLRSEVDFYGDRGDFLVYRHEWDALHEKVRRLTEGLRDLESAVRVLDVMLREPAAEGLMSAEDYRTYLQGAWLGVDEAAEKARALLSASPSDGKPKGGEA